MDRKIYNINGNQSGRGRIPIIQYQVSLYRDIIPEGNILFTTIVTFFMGKLICTGQLIPNNSLTEFIIFLAQDNESLKLKSVRIIEYFASKNVTILMERSSHV